MPVITSYGGRSLLEPTSLSEIKKAADVLWQNKDVAGAWQAVNHLKKELSSLPNEEVKAVLDDYRRLSANLKVLALPLLDWDEVKNLIKNNLTFLEPKYLPAAGPALAAWLAVQTDADQSARRDELLKLLPPDSPLAASLTSVKARTVAPQPGPSGAKPIVVSHDPLLDKDENHELASHAQKVGEMGGAPLSLIGRGSTAENILNLSQRQEDKESFLRRANALIASRLRDVRTRAELREYLGRPFRVGGLGLSGDGLDKASVLIEEEYDKLHSRAPVPPPPSPDIKAGLAAAIEPSVVQPEEKIEQKPVVPLPSPEPVTSKVEPKPAPKIEPAPPPPPLRVMRPARGAPANDKPRVDDIKSTGRTVSAVDELRLLTLADFRKFGSPEEAVKNILQKVQLLAQQSLSSKTQGIKMFRESELVSQYVAVGRASLAQGKKLTQALADKTLNPSQMTEDEFFAIALLNGKLK